MARIRSQSELVSSLLDFLRVAQPSLTTAPGSVTRDLFVDGLSAQIARLYDELGRVAALQSMRQALGIDLDRWADNFGASRGRGGKSTGTALLLIDSLDGDISITRGQTVTARNGAIFTIVNSTVVSSVLSSQYKATAAKYKSDLDFLGFTEEFAVEALVEATASGTQGNISKYTLSSTSIAGISHVTNVIPFGGGKPVEDDTAFKNRILAVFSGANTGTATGYKNAAKADPAVLDAIVIEPGDSLMTRDGTQVNVAEDGTRTVTSEGTGGKVDVIVFGTRLQEAFDSFIYRDLSNTGDPTNPKNDFVLGQIAEDAGKTVTKKRLDNLQTSTLPNQPVNNIVEVSGSLSGTNFLERTTDNLGRVTGNYELIRDTGAFAGSPWGFDRLRWINDRASVTEDKTKQQFNGQDTLGFTDVLSIDSIVQNISIVNENSKVLSSNRTTIQLAHSPVTNVTRVVNVTTGERYVVTNQNLDSTGVNKSGKITISGKSLPAVSDTLQVDYTWVFTFDPYFDYDNRLTNNNPREVRDSIDWGFSNAVRREKATLMTSGSYLTATVTHPISSIVSVNVFSAESASVILSSSRLAISVSSAVENVISVVDTSGVELWKTNELDGTFTGQLILLPTDTVAELGDSVIVTYNATDVFNADQQGNFNGQSITIVPSVDATAGVIVECTYIADVSVLLPSTLLSALPAVRSGNAFAISGTTLGVQPSTNIYSGSSVLQNLRQAPSNLALTIAGSISPGTITVSGITVTGVFDAVFTVGTSGLKQNISTALKQALGLNSSDVVPSTIRLVRIASVEKVTTTSNLDVLTIDHQYDIKGYSLFDNIFVKDEAVADTSLKLTEFTLPNTAGNTENAPVVGNRLRITFYYSVASDTESVSFSKSGTLYTNKRFGIIDTVVVSSGFTSAASALATLTISNLNQPITRSRYKTAYRYLAPKTNERINIKFNYDKLITDTTLAIEKTRPINADVLAKAAVPILVDVTMKIGVTEEFKNTSNLVLQNVQDVITSALNANALNTKIDSSDLVNQAYTVNGVDSARVQYFNKTGKTGSVLNIKAEKNQYIVANLVTVELDNG